MGVAQKKGRRVSEKKAKKSAKPAEIFTFPESQGGNTRQQGKNRLKAWFRQKLRQFREQHYLSSSTRTIHLPKKKRRFKHPVLNYTQAVYTRFFAEPVSRAIGAVIQKGTEKQALLFIPRSTQNTIRIFIPNYYIYIFLLVFLGTILFSLIFLNSHEADQTEITRLSTISSVRKKQIQAFRKSSDRSVRHFSLIWQEMNKLSRNFAGTAIQRQSFPFNTHSKDYLSEQGDNSSDKKLLASEERTLDKMGENIALSAEQLASINTYLRNMQQVLREVPAMWPVAGGGIISSPYGMRRSPFTGAWQMHHGIDISWWPGTPIRSTANGKIVRAGWMGGYGLCVIIKHKYGYSTRYAHLQYIRVKEGDTIKKGDYVGSMGNTGRSTGHHLHYEVMLNKKPLEPHSFMQRRLVFSEHRQEGKGGPESHNNSGPGTRY